MWGQDVLMGLLGFLLHWMGKAKQKHGGAIGGLKPFVAENALNILYGFIAYGTLMGVWYYYGLEMFGMKQGQFTGLTVFVGYSSSSIVSTWFAKGRPSEIPTEEKDQ